MSCNRPYIRSAYAGHPELINELERIDTDIWSELSHSKLFREYGNNLLFSKPGTERYNKQKELINKINSKYNTNFSLVKRALTKSGYNYKVVVSVHPIAEQVWLQTDAAQRVQDNMRLGITENGESDTNILANPVEGIKPGVEDVFNENPQLQKIGTPEQYSQYLNSIFPESKVHEIVYRGSENGINNDENSFLYFSNSPNDAYLYSKSHVSKGGKITERNPLKSIADGLKKKYNITFDEEGYITNLLSNKDIINYNKIKELYPIVKIESENDLMKQFDDEDYINNIDEYNRLREELEPFFNKKDIGKLEAALLNIKNPLDGGQQEDLMHNSDAYKNGHDGAALLNKGHFLVKNNLDQIHILGSKEDIEGFKKFVESKKSTEENKSLTRGQDPNIREKYFPKGNTASVKSVLTKISESDHPLAPLAKQLVKYNPVGKITLLPISYIKLENNITDKAAGVYRNGTNTIEIAENARFIGLGSEPTILHEILHLLSHSNIHSNTKLAKDFSKLFNYVKQFEDQFSDKYPLNNEDEFLTGIFTNAKFIDELRNLPPTDEVSGYKNLWEQILDYFKKLFGISEDNVSLLDQAIALGTNIINGDMEDVYYANNPPDVLANPTRLSHRLGSQGNAQTVNETPEEHTAKLVDNIIARDKVTDKRMVKERGEDVEKYFFNGKKVKRRVHDIIQNKYKAWSKNRDLTRTEEQKAIDDLKKEEGTKGHADLEHLLQLMTHETTHEVLPEHEFIAKFNADKDYEPKMASEDDKIYTTLRNNLWARLNSFPKGTKFLSEVQIVNDKKKESMGGTVDLMAFTPDKELGTRISLLDWKFMNLDTQRYSEVPWYNIESWRIQMNTYKRMMEEIYGINPKQFNQTRMIPILTSYDKIKTAKGNFLRLSKIEIGNVDVTKIPEGADYLMPVGLESESTGNPEIDTLLEKLNAIYSRKSGRAVGEEAKAEKATELNLLFKAIRHLQMRGDVESLILFGNSLKSSIQVLKNEYNDKYLGKDPKSFTDKEVSDFANKLDDALQDSEVFSTLTGYLGLYDQDVNNLSPKERETRERILEVVSGANHNVHILSDERTGIIAEFASEIIAKGRHGIDQLLNPERKVKGFTRLFRSTALLPVATIQTLYKIVVDIKLKADTDTRLEYERLTELERNYMELVARKGWSKKQMFDIIKKTDSNELIDQYKKDFYTTLQKAIQDGDTKWIEKNVDMRAYSEWVKEDLKKKLDRIERSHFNWERDKEKSRAIEDANLNDRSSRAWSDYKNLKRFPIKEWESEKFITLNKPENKAALDFYNHIIEFNKHLAEIGYIKNSDARKFLPFVRSSTVERALTGNKLQLGRAMLQGMAIDEGTVGHGSYDPITGELVQKIPAYFTHKLPNGEVSDDLFRNMLLLSHMAYRYRYLSDAEGQVNLLYSIEKGKKAIGTNTFGHASTSEGGNPSAVENSSNAQLYRDMMSALVYDQKISNTSAFDMFLGNLGGLTEKINDATKAKLGFKLLPNLTGSITATRVIEQVNRFFYLKMLNVFNLGSPLSNLFGGSSQVALSAGDAFSAGEYAASMGHIFVNRLAGDKGKLVRAAIQYFMPHLENTTAEMAKKLSVHTLTDQGVSDFIFSLMTHSDRAVTGGVLLALLKNSIIVEDNEGNKHLVNANHYVHSKDWYKNRYNDPATLKDVERKAKDMIKELKNTQGVLNIAKVEDGKFVIPGIKEDSEGVFGIRTLAQNIATDALGNMTEAEMREINMTLIGKSMMVFHNWIPRLVDVRFGQINYNSRVDAYEWGRMRTLMRVLSEQLFKQGAGLINSLKANEKGVKYLEKLYLAKKEEYEKMTNKEFKMSPDEFYDMVRQNIRSQIRDFIWLTVMFGIAVGVKAIPDDDEDPRVKGMHAFAARMADKLQNELSYYYSPLSFDQIVNGKVFPAAETVSSALRFFQSFAGEMYGLTVQNDKIIEKEHPLKYFMKTFPFASQLTSFLPLYAPEAAKEWGVRMSSTSRIQ